jgi:hypothetical protein
VFRYVSHVQPHHVPAPFRYSNVLGCANAASASRKSWRWLRW